MAKALDDKLSSENAVKKYKESLKSAPISESKSKEPIKPIKKAPDPKKLTSRSSEKLGVQRNDVTRSTAKQDKEKENDVKSKRKENVSLKSEPQNLKKIQQTKTINTKNGKDSNKEKKGQPKVDNMQTRNQDISSNFTEREKGHKPIIEAQSQESKTTKEDQVDKNINVDKIETPRMDQNDEGKLNSSYTIADNELNSSSSNDVNEIINNNKRDEINPQEINVNMETTLINVEHQNQTNSDFNDDIKLKSLDLDVNIQENPYSQAYVEPENMKDPVDKAPITSTSESKIPRPPSVRPSSSRPGAPRTREKLDNVIKDSDNLLLGKVNIIIENTQIEEVCIKCNSRRYGRQ